MAPIDHLEVVAPSKVAGSLWTLATTMSLGAVLHPGYWSTRFDDYPIRVHDRINVTASLNGKPEYATLVVTEVTHRKVTRVKPMESA